MPDTGKALEQVHPRLRPGLRELLHLLPPDSGEDGAAALTLFGPAVAASSDPDESPAATVVVLDRVNLGFLRRLGEHGLRLGKLGIAAPWVMTPAFIKASLDTFPLELLEIQVHHLVLRGEDHFEGVSFQETHVRLQCERELKSIVAGLRRGLLVTGGRAQFIHALEHEAGERLARTIRGMVWLKGMKTVKSPAEALDALERLLQRKLPGLRAAIDRQGHHDWDEFQTFYHEVEQLAEAVNAW